MVKIHFEWDDSKAEANLRKHGVSFEEAKSVFYDDDAMEFFDAEHSESEDRFILLGQSSIFRVLIICHCVRKQGSIIRLISARKATGKETQHYFKRKP